MKKFLIPIFAFLVLVFCYVYFENSKGEAKTSLVPRNIGANQQSTVVGAEIIALLQKLDRIKLDTSLFSEQTFQSLRDFSITLRPQAVGRPNPFAPIGTDTTGASNSASVNNGASAPSNVSAPAPEIEEEQPVAEESEEDLLFAPVE